MSGYIRREDRLFDPVTGAVVGFVDLAGNEVAIPVLSPGGVLIDPRTQSPVSGGGGGGGYTPPEGGIPKTDLSAAVQTSLGKADTAQQPAAPVPVADVLASTAPAGGEGTYVVIGSSPDVVADGMLLRWVAALGYYTLDSVRSAAGKVVVS